MRSKEEILNSSTIPDEMQTIWQYVQRPAAINAMDEYAKEMSVAYVRSLLDKMGVWHINGESVEKGIETTFNQFLQETKQS